MERLAHFFTPQHSNNHRAKFLHTSTHLVLIAFLILAQIGIRTVSARAPRILGYASQISVDEVVQLTNEKRAQEGLPPLTLNQSLSSAAYQKGAHMLEQDYWAHVAPDSTEPWAFFNTVGYAYRYAGENLARDFSSASTAVDAWMASPTHRDNIMSGNYSEIGIGVIEGDLGGKDTTLIVQFFGSPLDVVPVAETIETPTQPQPAPQTVPVEVEQPVIVEEATGAPFEPETQVASQVQSTVTVGSYTAPLNISRGVSLAILVALGAALVVDGVLIANKKVHRIAGRTVAHLSFLGIIMAAVIIARAGQIL